MCEEKMKINIEAKKKIITPFLDDDGKITRVPAPNKTKIPVLEYLAGKFEQQQIYNEKEVNEIIIKWHTFGDHYILRRLLIDYKFLDRTPNGAKYWVVKKEFEPNKKVFAPGCALMIYKPDLAKKVLDYLNSGTEVIEEHLTCCRHEPNLPSGIQIINTCAGCDKRYRESTTPSEHC